MYKKTTPETAPKVNAPIDGRIMFSNEKTELILITLQPGESIPSHKNPFDVIFTGLEGEATLGIGEESLILQPCQTLFASNEENRFMLNLSDASVKVMVTKILS